MKIYLLACPISTQHRCYHCRCHSLCLSAIIIIFISNLSSVIKSSLTIARNSFLLCGDISNAVFYISFKFDNFTVQIFYRIFFKQKKKKNMHLTTLKEAIRAKIWHYMQNSNFIYMPIYYKRNLVIFFHFRVEISLFDCSWIFYFLFSKMTMTFTYNFILLLEGSMSLSQWHKPIIVVFKFFFPYKSGKYSVNKIFIQCFNFMSCSTEKFPLFLWRKKEKCYFYRDSIFSLFIS